MDAVAVQVDLLAELRMLQKGGCIWCKTHASHPSYSQCPHKEAGRYQYVEMQWPSLPQHNRSVAVQHVLAGR